MIMLVEATSDDFKIIRDIAYRTWPITYGQILSKAQLTYMLESFYSIDGLQKNIENNHHFILANEDGVTLGFASYVHNYPRNSITKIPKIYVLPEAQGKGIGKLLVDRIALLARKNESKNLTLNVNRSNGALRFYQRLGFTIIGEENIPLEHGYLMEDYIMEKVL